MLSKVVSLSIFVKLYFAIKSFRFIFATHCVKINRFSLSPAHLLSTFYFLNGPCRFMVERKRLVQRFCLNHFFPGIVVVFVDIIIVSLIIRIF